MRLFLSVIGSDSYPACRFVDGDNPPSAQVRYVQEALLPSLAKDWTADDRIVTVMAGRPNTPTPSHLHTSTPSHPNTSSPSHLLWLTDWAAMPPVPQDDYRQRIEALGLPCQHQIVDDLPDGLQTEELWELFTRIYDLIHEEDEVWLDVTYGVRYFPMLMLSLDNYAKFLKHIHVRRITYANYQAMVGDEEKLVPIQDLTTFSALQDWTFASALFLETGRTQRLSQLAGEVIQPLLNDKATRTRAVKHMNRFMRNLGKVTDEWRMGRGSDIIEANMLAVLHQDATQIGRELLPPFMPLFDKISEVLEPFQTSEDVRNGFHAAQWCYDHQLYQQSITLLQESIITLICEQNGIDWHCSDDRELVGAAFHIVGMHLEKEEQRWHFAHSADPDEEECSLMILRTLVSQPLVRTLSTDYKYCSNVRNDLNHAGMRINPMSTSDIKVVVSRCLKNVQRKLAGFLTS